MSELFSKHFHFYFTLSIKSLSKYSQTTRQSPLFPCFSVIVEIVINMREYIYSHLHQHKYIHNLKRKTNGLIVAANLEVQIELETVIFRMNADM